MAKREGHVARFFVRMSDERKVEFKAAVEVFELGSMAKVINDVIDQVCELARKQQPKRFKEIVKRTGQDRAEAGRLSPAASRSNIVRVQVVALAQEASTNAASVVRQYTDSWRALGLKPESIAQILQEAIGKTRETAPGTSIITPEDLEEGYDEGEPQPIPEYRDNPN